MQGFFATGDTGENQRAEFWNSERLPRGSEEQVKEDFCEWVGCRQ